MSSEIWIALLSLLGTLIGSGFGVWQSSRLVNYRMEKLEQKMDKHNNLVERLALVEQSAKSAHRRLDEHLHNE